MMKIGIFGPIIVCLIFSAPTPVALAQAKPAADWKAVLEAAKREGVVK